MVLSNEVPLVGGEEMLTVDQHGYIRIAHRVYGKGIREIARETGHSKNTQSGYPYILNAVPEIQGENWAETRKRSF